MDDRYVRQMLDDTEHVGITAGDLLVSILTKTRHGCAIPLPDVDSTVIDLVRAVLELKPRDLHGGHFGPHPNWHTLRKMKQEAAACGSISFES